MNLHGTVGHAAYHFRAEQLAAGRIQTDLFTPVLAAGGFQHHGAAGKHFRPGIRQHGLNQLVFDDGLAELFALGGKIHCVFNQSRGHAHTDRRDMQAAPVQHFHGGLETCPFLATDNVLGGHPAIVENDVAGVGAFLAHFHIGLAAGNAGGIAFHDKGGNATATLDLRVGARHHGKQPRMGAIGDIAFGAIEDVVVAVPLGAGFHRTGVRAHIRFGQAEGANHFARGQRRDVFLFLLFGTINEDALGADAIIGAHQGAESRRGAAEFKGHQHFLFHGQPQAAVLLGDRQTE